MAKVRIPYSKKDLYRVGPQMTYSGRNLDEIAFPLGGIGTGMITLGGWGQLRDWEIQNRPAKGNFVKNAFFALRVRQGKTDVTKALQGPVEGSFAGNGHSVRRFTGEGWPHFRKVTFRGEFPFACVELCDPAMPVRVTLEAWNPFIPLDDRNSSIPVAILNYTIRNTSKKPLRATLFGTISNAVGKPPFERGDDILTRPGEAAARINEARAARGITGLYMTDTGIDKDSPRFGSMALAALAEDVNVHPRWADDHMTKLWEGMAEAAEFPPRERGATDTGTVAVDVAIGAGKMVSVPICVAWYFPNFEKYWGEKCACGEEAKPCVWKNWYATAWKDAWDVAAYVAENYRNLHDGTRAFHDALFSSTLPDCVLDAVSANISILKTPTALRLTDGTFYGFEGCSDREGCCEGSCTHVWNYAQAPAYLFPALQRSQREVDYEYSHREDGYGQFRIPLPLGTKPDFHYPPAADGQMGAVCQVYREWLISGDTKWLKSIWPYAKRALEFAWTHWDADRDGVMEGVQHNTYDIEFYGPNTLMGSLYLAALCAGARMAEIAGDGAAAEQYRALVERGSKWTDANLFNGEYYEQKVNPGAHETLPEPLRTITVERGRDDRFPWPKYQYGKGCLADQLLGQWYAEMLGLGKLYDSKKIRKALLSIFRHNWRADLSDHPALLRLYALRDEAGLLVCTWPRGGRPGFPVVYGDEVWCGIEYQVASHLIYEGFVDEGLAVVKGVRERHRGDRRNPWDEFECGHHYSRSMASYALLLALSGFTYNAAAGRMGFAPRVSGKDFRVFWSVGSGWGTFAQKLSGRKFAARVDALYGKLVLRELGLAVPGRAPRTVTVSRGGEAVKAALRKSSGGVTAVFDRPITIEPDGPLELSLS